MRKINIKPFYSDKRGLMSQLLDLSKHEEIKSVLLISSKKGSIRANHFHHKDMHYTYILSGEMEYYEKPANSKNKQVKSSTVKKGEMVKTNPEIIHAMKFTKDSVMIVFTTEDRDRKSYERDTVRIKIID